MANQKISRVKTTNGTNQEWLAHGISGMCKAVRPVTSLILLIALVALATCATSSAQSIIGSPGAAFQKWTAADLNNNSSPYWDGASENSLGNQTNRNVGFCLTGTGDCVGIDTAVFAPGPIPFWGMSYDPVNDHNGAIDPKVYFESRGTHLKATLQLQLSSFPTEINEFGWFETDTTGTVLGPRHKLFQGSGVPTGTLTPDPAGKTVIFKPTKYFGYYYSDVSEGGCLVYTISSFTTDPNCSGHNFAVFATKPGSRRNAFVIAGEDPPGCTDGDCNLTLVRVDPKI